MLTFRNLHNWMDGRYAPEVIAACFRALKPGGILGIEEHRGRTDRPQDPSAKSGTQCAGRTACACYSAGESSCSSARRTSLIGG